MENIWGAAELWFLSLTGGVSMHHKSYGYTSKFSVCFLPIGVAAQMEPQAEFPPHLCTLAWVESNCNGCAFSCSGNLGLLGAE